MQTTLCFPDVLSGIVMAIHTFGEDLDFHPHLHALVADGLFTRDGRSPTWPGGHGVQDKGAGMEHGHFSRHIREFSSWQISIKGAGPNFRSTLEIHVLRMAKNP